MDLSTTHLKEAFGHLSFRFRQQIWRETLDFLEFSVQIKRLARLDPLSVEFRKRYNDFAALPSPLLWYAMRCIKSLLLCSCPTCRLGV